MARVLVTEVSRRFVAELGITLASAPLVTVGTVTFQPDLVTATYARRGNEAWNLIALAVAGERVVNAERREEERRTQRYQHVADAPRWMQSLSNSYTPSRS